MQIRRTSALRAYVILLALAVLLALALPPNPATLHQLRINVLEYRAVVVTLIVPYAAIWFSAFYAYDKLEEYAAKLHRTEEGSAFKKIANGVRVLAWGLVVPTIIGTILSALQSWHADFHAPASVFNQYMQVAFPVVAFIIIGNGTRDLTELVGVRPGIMAIRAIILAFTILGVLFVHFVINNQFNGTDGYHLPLYPLILTIIVPYLFTWIIGLLSVYELRIYAAATRGVLYRQALVSLGTGLAIVIIDSIIVQYLTGAFGIAAHASIGFLLLIVYLLLVVQAAGYALVALGAKKLKRIEEV